MSASPQDAPSRAARRGLAGRLVVGVAGPRLLAREAGWLERWRPAGVILFARNVIDLPLLLSLCRDIRARIGPGAEIAVDHEGGPISVLAAAIGRPPAPWGLGRLGDADLTRRVHAETGARLREAGVTRVLAPCADVLIEPRNPVIGVRSFGSEPGRVSAHVAAAVTGLRAGGVTVCLKHWPGHGGTIGDSHVTPVDTAAGACEEPFLAGLAAGAEAVMVGHLPDSRTGGEAAAAGLPATLDPDALRRLRRLAPGHHLRLYADDVTMRALAPALLARGVPTPPADATGMIEPGQLPASWLQGIADAGCDILLVRGIPWLALPSPDTVTGTIDGGDHGGAVPAAGLSCLCPAAVYMEARVRLAAMAGGDPFPVGAARFLWLDGTRGDRWGDASPLAAALRARFSAGETEAIAREESVALLVTSHRPLAPAKLAMLRRPGVLAAKGGCLALGHPALAADLQEVLPPGWRLTVLPDLDADALSPLGSREDGSGAGPG